MKRRAHTAMAIAVAVWAFVGSPVVGSPVVTSVASAQPQRQPLPRWSSAADVMVWIDPVDAPMWGPGFVSRALAVWSRAAGPALRLKRTPNAATASIRVRFMTSGALYGETVPQVDRASGRITHAAVYITGAQPAGRQPAGSPEDDSLEAQIVVYLTTLHEIGHAIGLSHTDRFSDIMYRFQEPGDGARYFGRYRRLVRQSADIGTGSASGLSSDDVQAVRDLYAR